MSSAPAAAASSGGPIIAAALVGVQVGAGMVVTRLIVDETGVGTLALLRYLIAFLCVIPLVAARRAWPAMGLRDFLSLSVLGMVQFGVSIALLNFGLHHVAAARAALIFSVFPLLTMLLAALLGQEQVTWRKAVGVLATIAGVGVALSEKLLAGGSGGGSWIGEIAVFAAAFTGAASSVLTRPYLARYAALPVGALAMLAAAVSLLPLALWDGSLLRLPQLGAGGWTGVIYIGISSGVAYVAWLWALHHTTPTKVTIFLGLSPITAALLGVMFLDEHISLGLLLGLGLLLAGLALAFTQPRQTAE